MVDIYLAFLKNFNCIFKWRLLQEQKLKLVSKNKKKEIMSKNKIKEFIMFYERITKQMMKDSINISNLIIYLDEKHRSRKIEFLNK